MNKTKETPEFEKRIRYLVAQLNLKNFDKPEGMYCNGKFYYSIGKSYVKVIQGQGSVKFFINQITGQIYKSKSWNSPNRNWNYGNIGDEDFGFSKVETICFF